MMDTIGFVEVGLTEKGNEIVVNFPHRLEVDAEGRSYTIVSQRRATRFAELLQKKALQLQGVEPPPSTAVLNDWLAAMVMSSFRYALGRRSYVVRDTVQWMTSYWPLLSPWHGLIRREIQDAIRTDDAGDPMDEAFWGNILELPVAAKDVESR